MEIILLLIVAACVIVLICLIGKFKELDEGGTVTSEPHSTSSSTSTATNTHQEEDKPSGSPQNTIYEFSSRAGKRLCPFCDGENSGDAKACGICGRDI